MTKVMDRYQSNVLASPQIQHTLGHYQCPACDIQRATLLHSISAESSFGEAAKIYIQLRTVDATPGAVTARYVSPHTIKMYNADTKALDLFFTGMRLKDIHWYHMRAYQQARLSGAAPFIRYRRPQDAKPRRVNGVEIPAKGKTPCPAKPQQCNRELGFLRLLKQRAACWTEEDETYYEALTHTEEEALRALSPEQQLLWLDIARQREEWAIVYHWSVVSFDLCTSTNELRGLRLGDIVLPHRLVSIPWPCAKNKARKRTIPIENADCLWSLEWLLHRAADLGSKEPMHYLFPFHKGQSKYDPARHMTESGIKKPWQAVREASGLLWFRPYDTRHTGGTRLAEAGVPPEIIKRRMGHMTDEMYERYTHISEAAQRRWLQLPQRDPRYVTQHMYAPPPAPWPESPYGQPNNNAFLKKRHG